MMLKIFWPLQKKKKEKKRVARQVSGDGLSLYLEKKLKN